MEMIYELIYVHNTQCPRCGKNVCNTSNIKGVELHECEKCGTIFKNHIVFYMDELEEDYENFLDNN